jgi:hypothetical protein
LVKGGNKGSAAAFLPTPQVVAVVAVATAALTAGPLWVGLLVVEVVVLRFGTPIVAFVFNVKYYSWVKRDGNRL